MTSQRIVAVMAKHFFFVEFFNSFGIFHTNALLSSVIFAVQQEWKPFGQIFYVCFSEVTTGKKIF